MTRPCDAIGCGKLVPTGRFMCIDHWRMVPTVTQRSINYLYRSLRNDRYALMHDTSYVEACAVAIEYIAAAQGLPGDNSYRRVLEILKRKNHAGDKA